MSALINEIVYLICLKSSDLGRKCSHSILALLPPRERQEEEEEEDSGPANSSYTLFVFTSSVISSVCLRW